MRYWIFGRNGFVERHPADALTGRGLPVVVCDLSERIDGRIKPGCERTSHVRPFRADRH